MYIFGCFVDTCGLVAVANVQTIPWDHLMSRLAKPSNWKPARGVMSTSFPSGMATLMPCSSKKAWNGRTDQRPPKKWRESHGIAAGQDSELDFEQVKEIHIDSCAILFHIEIPCSHWVGLSLSTCFHRDVCVCAIHTEVLHIKKTFQHQVLYSTGADISAGHLGCLHT